MKTSLAFSIFFFVVAAFSTKASAQARPDTSLNTIVSDSLRERGLAAQTQADTTTAPNDSIAFAQPFVPKPKKAALYSAMLPGAGQFYNRQIWKVPIIYVGMGASFYFLIDNTNGYRQYRRAYIAATDGDPTTVSEFEGFRTPSDLQTIRDYYRRNLDITVLLTAVGYTVQVLDALVYAHLRGFDVSQDISLRLQPVQHPGGVGLGLVAHFR